MPKERKARQRREYHQAFDKLKIHHNHGSGGRFIKKKEQAALGRDSDK